MTFKRTAAAIGAALQEKIPTRWDGRNSIMEMKDSGFRHWKQMEWVGFYFQFLCERIFSGVMEMPGPRYGRVAFDAFVDIPWDFKAHAANTSNHKIIINDAVAIRNALKDYGAIGAIVAVGDVRYNDEKRTFQRWHERVKGGKSQYEIDRVRRGAWSRLRKVSFDLKQVSFLKITERTLIKGGSFQQDFRNADGGSRNAKLLIDLEKMDKELEHYIDFT